MDSQTTISVDRNLVENVEATLRNIGGYCPSDIVAKAREKNPCITLMIWRPYWRILTVKYR